MGSYCEIKFDKIHISSAKSAIPDHYVLLFQDRDRQVVRDAENECDDILYVASREIVLQRLELQGYTSQAARNSFERWLNSERERWKEYVEADGYEWAKEGHALIEQFDFDMWRTRLRSTLTHRYGLDAPPGDHIDAKMRDLQDNWLNWVADELLVFRAMLDELTEINKVTLDIGELVRNGYVEGDADLLTQMREQASLHRPLLSPVVVVGEGSSDSNILRRSLEALYPDLTDYFVFFDHGELSVDGGASYLVKFLRAFGAVRIAARVIAIFDNDAAGSDAFAEASALRLPENITVCKLPETDLARAYPTIGPQGHHVVDINGRAASIELYLGRHNLLDQNGQLRPVYWSGPVGRTRTFQGAILRKEEVTKAFLSELDASKSVSERLARYPELVALWSGIFEHLRASNSEGAIRDDATFDELYS